jgi:hypothetical protein
MKPFFFLLALATLAAACPPISNDFFYLGNATNTTVNRDTFNNQLG